MTREEKFDNLNRIINWINNCDTKASIILTLQGVIMTILLTSDFSSGVYETFSRKFVYAFKLNNIINFMEGIVLLLFFFFSLKQFYYSIQVLYARINPKLFEEEGLNTNSTLFFDSISDFSFLEFKQKINPVNKEEEDNDLESQIFINSKICSLKFKNYNNAIKNLKYSVIFGIIYAIINVC